VLHDLEGLKSEQWMWHTSDECFKIMAMLERDGYHLCSRAQNTDVC
jgi:hypothetical protein